MKRLLKISIVLNFILASLIGYYLIFRNSGNPFLPFHWEKYGYWKERNSHLATLPIDSTCIVFVGNSLTDGAEWAELLNNPSIKNRGIGGDNSEGLLQRIGGIAKGKPAQIFIDEGINDICYELTVDQYIANMKRVIELIRYYSPGTIVKIQSILPTFDEKRNKKVVQWNTRLRELCEAQTVSFINTYYYFKDPAGNLEKKLSSDGIHLTGEGYLVWKKAITPYL